MWRAWLAAAVLAYAAWSYYGVAIAMDDAMMLFGHREAVIAVAASAAALFFCWRIWGAPVALLGVLGIVYLITGPYWPGFLQTAGGDLNELLAQNLWYSLDTGILGGTFAIVITTVFPFIVLGALLEGAGAGESMIRIAFSWMRNTAGGPAHAAVLSSALVRLGLGQRGGQCGRHRRGDHPDDQEARLLGQLSPAASKRRRPRAGRSCRRSWAPPRW